MAASGALELFIISGSPYAWRAQLGVEAKKLDYKLTPLAASKGEHKAPAYLAMNPRGKVPTLKHGDQAIYESLAILAYLDQAFPEPKLFGKTAAETARIWRLISEFDSYAAPHFGGIVLPLYFGTRPGEGPAIVAAAAAMHGELGALERAVGNNTYLVGNTITAADLAIYPFVRSILRAAGKEAAQPLNLGFLPIDARYPGLARWLKAIEAMPGFQKTWPPHWN
jgi:glutathione S-transferase